MGPYSEEKQKRRRELIATVILNTNDPTVKSIWDRHLNNLAQDENEYNARVVEIYGDKTWNQYIGIFLPTL